jgi:glutamate synthase domain-containing protein 2
MQIAIARGTARVETAMGSGEGGILPEARDAAHRFIFEYVPNRYSVTEDNLRAADAVEIKIGQSAKPGMGGHLPGAKVTEEIAEVRGFPPGKAIHSPSRFPDIGGPDGLREKVVWLRETSGGRPVGVKIAAGHVEADLEVALAAEPDFVTIDGRPGGTGAAPKFVKAATSVPTLFALYRARRFLDDRGADGLALIITGGLRVSADFAKALALGADAVAIGTAAMMACGCQQYRVCNTGNCPVGVATQDPELRERFDIDASATMLANFLRVCTWELEDFARLTGHADVHDLSIDDLCTTNSEVSGHTAIAHV